MKPQKVEVKIESRYQAGPDADVISRIPQPLKDEWLARIVKAKGG